MKKFLFIVLAIIGFTCKAQVASEGYVAFRGGLHNTYTTPYFDFVVTGNDVESTEFRILIQKVGGYSPILNEGRLLLKFANDSVITLNTVKVSEGGSHWVSGTRYTSGFYIYYTYAYYTLDEAQLDLILSLPIVKMRIELENGENLTYDTSKSRAESNQKDLNKILEKTRKSYAKKVENTSGGGFEENF